jgi:pSer/pThr/pTyr-binding forkhead associated (FHA) protein
MQVELRIVGSTRPGSSLFMIGAIQIGRDKFLIGRDPECHFRPNSALVSRHHCVILKDQYAVRIRDLGSRNGTLVNSQPIHGDCVLKNEDVIVVGDLNLQVFIEADGEPASESDTTVTHHKPSRPAPSPTVEVPRPHSAAVPR